jgi:hypothetical protein
MFNASQVQAILCKVREAVSLSWNYDSALVSPSRVQDQLMQTRLAFQLVRPTSTFGEYWCVADDAGRISQSSRDLPWLHIRYAQPYLWYQQHHQITIEDIEAVKQILPKLFDAFAPPCGAGSWNHPAGAIHRALIMFSEGYLHEMFMELRPFLWMMALDCLFASRTRRDRQGAGTIGDRLQKLFGSDYKPYERVQIPRHQTRPNHQLRDIVKDMFTFRNACAHGLTIPNGWLTPAGGQLWESYAYQLCECAEILLRQTLLLILKDQKWFDTFVDSGNLDNYFG